MLSKNKRRILKCLSKYDYRRPCQIANECDIHKNTVSNILSELKKEGYVYCMNPEYNRPRLYRITPKGKKMLDS